MPGRRQGFEEPQDREGLRHVADLEAVDGIGPQRLAEIAGHATVE